jgi:hypothetical protein
MSFKKIIKNKYSLFCNKERKYLYKNKNINPIIVCSRKFISKAIPNEYSKSAKSASSGVSLLYKKIYYLLRSIPWRLVGTLSRVGQLYSITGLSPSMVVFSNTFIYTCHTSLRPWEVGLPASHRVCRVPRYLGTLSKVGQAYSTTGLSPSLVVFSNTFVYTCHTLGRKKSLTAAAR